jgi:TPR repeat protein
MGLQATSPDSVLLHALGALDEAMTSGAGDVVLSEAAAETAGLALQDIARVRSEQPDHLVALLAQRELILTFPVLLPVGRTWAPHTLLRRARRAAPDECTASAALLRRRPNSGFCQAVLAVLLGEVMRDRAAAASIYEKTAALPARGWALRGLGLCHLYGWGSVPRDFDAAARCFMDAVACGSVRALFNLARCYEGGVGLTQCLADALAALRRAAKAGFPPAQARLGMYYAKSWGVPLSTAEAVRLYHEAALRGDANAQQRLGLCQFAGDGVPQDRDAAYTNFAYAAAQGLGEALYAKGLCLQQGLGTPADLPAALAAFRSAAARRVPEALNALGLAYLEGAGDLDVDAEAAQQHFEEAVKHGSATAALNLALLLQTQAEAAAALSDDAAAQAHGQRAAKLLRRASSEGNRLAVYRLACALEQGGLSLEVNLWEALELYQQAADAGHPAALCRIGTARLLGQGLPSDPPLAARLLALAAHQRHPEAQNNLGVCYVRGTGVPKDPAAAEGLFAEAARMGSVAAAHNYGRILLNGSGARQNHAEGRELLEYATEHAHLVGLGIQL